MNPAPSRGYVTFANFRGESPPLQPLVPTTAQPNAHIRTVARAIRGPERHVPANVRHP